jgi:hypothetical protein
MFHVMLRIYLQMYRNTSTHTFQNNEILIPRSVNNIYLLHFIYTAKRLNIKDWVGLRRGPAGQLLGSPTRIIGNTGARKLRFLHANNFSEKYQQFRHATSKPLASPVLCRKMLNIISLKRLQIISLARGADVYRAGRGYRSKGAGN